MTDQHTDVHNDVEDDTGKQRFWRTVPGMLTAATGFVGAIGALVVTIQGTGLLGGSHPVDPTPAGAAPVTVAATGPLPGADVQGWRDSFARCDPGHAAAAIGKTKQSLLVMCQTAPGNFYYRGVRIDAAQTIELANGVRSSAGFDVTNPVDGTRYEIRPDALTFVRDGTVLGSEQMQKYWSS